MNFRSTTLLFGVLLGLLWVFGLILAMGRSALDSGLVLPKFAKEIKGDITSVQVVKEGKPYATFTKTKDGWKLKLEGNAQEVKADESEVDGLIFEIRNARHSNEESDVTLNRNLETWNLDSPKASITLRSADGGAWTLNVGKQSDVFAFVNSSERPREVLAVKRSALPLVLFDDVNKFRLRRLLAAKELSTREIDLRDNRDGKQKELVLEKLQNKNWWFKNPPLGPANLEGVSASKLDIKSDDPTSLESRSFLADVTNLTVTDFEPIGSPVTVDEKDAQLRIKLTYETTEFGKGDTVKPETKTEVLLIGGKVRDKDQYYARLADDNSVVIINADRLKPIFALIDDPRPLRSRDISFIETASVDAVEIHRGKEFANLFKLPDGWKVFSSDAPPKAGSDSAIVGASGLLSAIQGRQKIGEKDFDDPTSDEKLKGLQAKFAADKIDAKISVWSGGSLQPDPEKKEPKKDEVKEPKKDEPKKDDPKASDKGEKKDQKADDKKAEDKDEKKAEQKDAKADDKKEQKADEKKADAKDDKKADQKDAKADEKKEQKADEKKADTKDDKKAEQKDAKAADKQETPQTPPQFKEGARPAVTLSFVQLDKDKVLVKRELPVETPASGKEKDKDKEKDKAPEIKTAVTYFTLPTATYEKLVPREMALALYDTKLKTFVESEVVKLELSRAPAKDRDKMMERFVLELEKVKEKDKDKKDETKKDETKKDEVKDAQKKDEPKTDDQKKAGDEKKDADKKQDAPGKLEWKLREPADFVGKGKLETGEIDHVLDVLSGLTALRWERKATLATLEEYSLDDKHWTVRVVVTPKKKEGDKEEPKPFVLRLGRASNRDTDKGAVFAYQEGTDFVFLVDSSIEKLLNEVEFRDRQVLTFDPTKVKELRVYVTTTEKEVRKPVFERDADKSWKDKKEILGFKIDNRRVNDLLDKLANLHVVRYLGIKGDLPKDYELGDAAPLRFEVVMDDDKTIHTITVGAASEKNGPYYAQTSALPGHVFLLGRDPFSELMGKVTYFRKD